MGIFLFVMNGFYSDNKSSVCSHKICFFKLFLGVENVSIVVKTKALRLYDELETQLTDNVRIYKSIIQNKHDLPNTKPFIKAHNTI